MGTRIRKVAVLTALALTPAVTGIATAGVAAAEVGVLANNVAISGDRLNYNAGAETNSIVLSATSNAIEVDDVVVLTPGVGCWYPTADHTRVACVKAGVAHIRVTGGAGNDVINNVTSIDSTLWGESGDDTIFGGFGNDILRGDGGKDWFSGRGGRDGVTYWGYGAPVNASLDGENGDDGTAGEGDTILTDVEDLYGGTKDDNLTGSASVNYLNGNEGNDNVFGLAGDDHLEGGTGVSDFLNGGAGSDTCTGGDTLVSCP